MKETACVVSYLPVFRVLSFCLLHMARLPYDVVFDSFTSQSVSWGKGNFGIFNSSDGSVITGNYIGGSPAFEFIPHNIQSDEVLKQLNVAVGTQETAGVFNFTLTLFTSGNAQEKDPSRWTQLGAWAARPTEATIA